MIILVFVAFIKTGEGSSDLVKQFLIESSAKGVRIKGSSQEPYFGKYHNNTLFQN